MIAVSVPITYPNSLKTRHGHGFDNLIAFTAFNVKTLLECSKERVYYQQRLLPALPIFVRHVFYHCKLTPAILVVAIIYLDRLKRNLPLKSIGEFDTPYKMFIASTILATKFIEDSNTIAQSIYRLVSPLYNSKEISEMERSFLGVVKYNLFVNRSQVNEFIETHKELELIGINSML